MSATIFTYPPHYAIAAIAARALARLGQRVFIAIDARDPLPAIEGAEVVRTRFPRNHNLNGKPCVEGILRTLADHADDSPWQLKVDSDTLVLSLDWLASIPPQATAAGLQHAGNRILYGCCYALATASLPAFREAAADLSPGGIHPEDVTIGSLLPGLHPFQHRGADCPFAAYSWEAGHPPEHWRSYQVLCFQQIQGRGLPDVRQAMLAHSLA